MLDRFKETRRATAGAQGPMVDGIRAERGCWRRCASGPTSSWTPPTSRAAAARRIADELLGRGARQAGADPAHLRLQERTAARRGPDPRRPLPAQPHYVDELRPLTGLDAEVRRVRRVGHPGGRVLRPPDALLEFLVPAYVAEGKSHLTIAIGCTGGRHRSITVADASPATSRARRRELRVPSDRDVGQGRDSGALVGTVEHRAPWPTW